MTPLSAVGGLLCLALLGLTLLWTTVVLFSLNTSITPLPRSPHPTRTIADGVVADAYASTFASLTHCHESERQCMQQVNTSVWWFHTMARDSQPAHGWWHDLCAPSISMCTIEKIATSQWRYVFCLLNNNTDCYPGTLDYLGKVSNAQCIANPRFVVVRDPLERFLSAYLDKCERRRDEQHCEPLDVFDVGQIADNLTNAMRFQAYVNAMPLKWNLHFLPQSIFCNGLRRRIAQYDAVVRVDSHFYTALQRLNTQFPQLRTATEQVFQLDVTTTQSNNNGTETQAVTKLLQYYTADTIRTVLSYYAVDYVDLGLDIPLWASTLLERG